MTQKLLNVDGVYELNKEQLSRIIGSGGGCLECGNDSHCPEGQICERAHCVSAF